MITESLTTTGNHVLCRYCGRPLRSREAAVTTTDATGNNVAFIGPDYHAACWLSAHTVYCGTVDPPKKKEIPYWVKLSREHDRKRSRRK